MESGRFDAMSRVLATSADRRRTLRVVAAALLGGGAAASVADASAIRVTCRPLDASCLRGSQCCTGVCNTARTTPRNRRNRCTCPAEATRCGSDCRELQTDFAHCGACDGACDPVRASACLSGACSCGEGPACDEGFTCDEGICRRTPCMDMQYCAIGVDGDVIAYQDVNWTWFGLSVQVQQATVCTTDAECDAAAECYWRPCRCAVETWEYLGTQQSDRDGNCVQARLT